MNYRKRMPFLRFIGGLLLAALALSIGFVGVLTQGSSAQAAPLRQPTPPSPPTLPSAPPVVTPPSFPSPQATSSVIPTVAPPATPPPAPSLPTAPATTPISPRPSAEVTPDTGKAAFVTLVARGAPNLTAAPGAIVALDIVAVNRGEGTARNLVIEMPLIGLPLSVLDASGSRPDVWVSRSDQAAVTIRAGSISANNGIVTATLRLRVNDNAPNGAALGARLTARWADGQGGGQVRSNIPTLRVAAQNASVEQFRLEALDSLTFRSDIFAPDEPIAFWYQPTTGNPLPAGQAKANPDGQLTVLADTTGLAAGSYTLVARGAWTEFTTVALLSVP